MNILQVNQTTELLPHVGHSLKKAGRYYAGPCPFCGGRDRFTVKPSPDGDRWHCRQCGDGKYHTAIDYIMRRDNCDFKTAYRTLTGEDPEPTKTVATRIPKPKSVPINLPSHEWQMQAWRLVDRASNALLLDEGKAGREYLTRRGLHRGTWYANHLGFVNEMQFCDKDSNAFDGKTEDRPAIVIPWFDMDSQGEIITQIHYRIIGATKDKLRTNKQPNVDAVLFGLWSVLESDTTLLLVEGEINALSLWQCRPRGVSVLSFGSQGGGRADVLQIIAKKYERVFVWCDDAAWTMKYQSMLARPCQKIQSLKIDGDKLDANQLLQKGELHYFINHILGVECLDR